MASVGWISGGFGSSVIGQRSCIVRWGERPSRARRGGGTNDGYSTWTSFGRCGAVFWFPWPA